MRRQIKLRWHNAHIPVAQCPLIGVFTLVRIVEVSGHPVIGRATWARALVECVISMPCALSANLHAFDRFRNQLWEVDIEACADG